MTETVDKSGRAVRRYSQREGQALFDREARTKLGITATEFVRRWRSGDYDSPDSDTPEIVSVAMFLQSRSVPRTRARGSR